MARLEQHDQILHTQSQTFQKIESQLGHIAQALSKREEGKLPSQPVANPRNAYQVDSSTESIQAITLRSGKELETPAPKETPVEPNLKVNPSPTNNDPVDDDFTRFIPPVPYPKSL
jgi:hypothetical protein